MTPDQYALLDQRRQQLSRAEAQTRRNLFEMSDDACEGMGRVVCALKEDVRALERTIHREEQEA